MLSHMAQLWSQSVCLHSPLSDMPIHKVFFQVFLMSKTLTVFKLKTSWSQNKHWSIRK